MAANLLGQRGFRVAAFDVSTSEYHLPRAAHFDAEIMRVFQSVGLAEVVLPACAQVRGMHFLNAAGEKLLAFDAPDRLTQHGWPSGYLFYQPELERAIRAGAERFPSVDVFGGHEVLSIEQTPDAVAVRVRDLTTNEERTAEADWLWGCDGARSLTRKTLGIELDDLEFDQPWLVVDTMLRREVALQICNPVRPMTFVPSAGRHRRWEFMLLPGEIAEEMERDDTVWRLLGPWITHDETEVIRAVVYSFHALIAKSYRDGRALILGDAAHQMPPFMGQGMCAGIRDAANLAWKLDLIRQGLSCESLLDTYYEERAPHVRAIITRAVTAGRIIQTTDHVVAENRDRMFLAAEKRDLVIGEAGGGLETRMPGLASGLFDPQTASRETVGQMFPQPLGVLDEGALRLDDLYSGRFAIVAGENAARLFTPEVRAAWRFLDAQFVQVGDCAGPLAPWPSVREINGQLSAWLAENCAAVVRPDLYVYGVAQTAAELVRLARSLRDQLGRPHP